MKNFGKVFKKCVRFYMQGMNRTSTMYLSANTFNMRKF